MSQTKNVLKCMMRLTLLVSMGFAALLLVSAPASAQVAPNLLSAGTYSILAGSQVTNTGPTSISGDVGISPGAGAPGANHPGLTPVMVGGTIHDKDVAAAAAQFDQAAAYTQLDLLNGCTVTFAGAFKELAGETLVPGVYCATSFHLSGGTLTLSGLASDTWVFKSASDLIISGGAAAKVVSPSCDVWWRVVSTATFDAGSSLIGNILADTSITLAANASLSGKAFARTAEVTLSSNIISVCVAPLLPGSITINKTAVGGNGTFGYTASAALGTSFNIDTLGGTGSHGTTTGLSAGAYTVTESTMPAGWVWTGLACTDSTAGSTFGYVGAQANIALAPGGTVTCTYTNNLPPVPPVLGSITINKTAVGGNGTFGYTGSAALGAPFNIDTLGGAGSHGTTTGLLAGAYFVNESTMPAGWVWTGLACTDSTAGSTFGYVGAQANIALAPGGTVTCTYTNVKQGSITINKTAVGGDATFGYTASAALGTSYNITTSGGTGSHGTTTGLSVGLYTVTESTVPAGWVRTGLVCTDSTGGSMFSYSGAQANIALAAGGTVTCTFTNNLAPPPTAVPTLNEWGVIIFMVLVGLMSIYYLRRQKAKA